MSDKLAGGIKAGRTSVSLPVEFRKTSDSTELTGKVYTDVTAYYWRQGGTPTAITMATLSGPSASYSSGGFCEADGTNMKGLFRFDAPNACFATGADWVAISLAISGAFVASFMFALETKGASDLTDQTGDSFARIGIAGAGLTALGDTRLANLDTNVGSRMATYTQPTGFLAATFPAAIASTTNITAGTITTVTTLTNLPTAPTDWLTAASVKADAATKITTAVWIANPAGFTSGSIGYTLNNRITSIKTKTDALSDTPAADVWEILTADHSTTGTFGAAMAAAGTAGDPWTTPLPGTYGPGTAGYIVGHFSSGVTVDLSAVVSAQVIAQAALGRIQAAVYDTARVSGNVIFMSDGHTQRLTAGGRQTV